MDVDLRNKFAHILWIGGSPCSGKSSIANLLAAAYGLSVYHVDEAFFQYQQCITLKDQPELYRWTHSSWDELWMRPVEVLLPEVIACYSEHFDMVLADLLRRGDSERVLVEGTCLLPDRVAPLLNVPDQAIWIVLTEQFQREKYGSRGAWVGEILAACAEPEVAFKNWMDRDVAIGRWVLEWSDTLGLDFIEVDGSRTVTQNAGAVAEHLGLVTGD